MTLRQLAFASARFHLRSHLGVVLGTALAGAVLIGALAVGDSVQASLRQRALSGVGAHAYALSSGERYFSDPLWTELEKSGLRGLDLLEMPATAARGDGTRLANHTRLFGVASNFPGQFSGRNDATPLAFAEAGVWINDALAQRLNLVPGDPLVLRFAKPSALSRDAIMTARTEATIAWRVKVQGILPASQGGDLAVQGASGPAVFAERSRIARLAGLEGRANLILATSPATERSPTTNGLASLEQALRKGWNLPDAELGLRSSNGAVELVSRRIFLEPAVVQAALSNANPGEQPIPVLTYLVNSLRHANALTPYSMVTAAGAPFTPVDLQDDQIVVSDWLARDLGVQAGDVVDLSYYRADAGTQLVEATNHFRVHSIVPLSGRYADRSLMPEFPGLAKAESTHDWDAGFELIHPIREQDEAYWKQHRGTPKAWITLAAGQRMWTNRFGSLTAIRWPATNPVEAKAQLDTVSRRIRAQLDPAAVGLRFQPVREQALRAAESGTGNDFGSLFLSLSCFLIVSALLLTAMLFRFSLEQRAGELGTLLALGWAPRQVRRLYGWEGLVLALLGNGLGAGLGVLYGVGVVYALNTIWRAAVGGTPLQFAATGGTVVGGMLAGIAIAAGTLWWTLRQALHRPARELLNEGLSAATAVNGRATPRAVMKWVVALLFLSAVGLAGHSLRASAVEQQEGFFFAGMFCLTGALLAFRGRLRRPVSVDRTPAQTLAALAGRAPSRQPSRSLATVTLLAVATFLIVAIAAYRLDATRDATARSAGTGGFALWAESTLPVLQDLDTRKGQEFYGLNPRDLTHVNVVSVRVQDGDEASCLNLNRAQRPRLLGIRVSDFAQRHAFTFTQVAPGHELSAAWEILSAPPQVPGEIAAVGDAQSIQWALGRKIGDTLDYVDERGVPFRVRLVGAVANSVLQGSLVIDEAELVRRFPSAGGYRAFLMDVRAPSGTASDPAAETSRVAGLFSRALSDVGFEVRPMTDRLAQFNAVQNTYLNTFQILGGLGLLLGSAGLGVVVLRNVLERRGELAVMAAVGFRRKRLAEFVMREHLRLLLWGLGIGMAAAAVAVLPAWFNPSGGFPWLTVGVTLGVVLVNGLLWTWLAARRALSGNLLTALRGE